MTIEELRELRRLLRLVGEQHRKNGLLSESALVIRDWAGAVLDERAAAIIAREA